MDYRDELYYKINNFVYNAQADEIVDKLMELTMKQKELKDYANTKLRELKDEIKDYQREVSSMEKEIDDYQNKLEKLETENDSLLDKIERYKEIIETRTTHPKTSDKKELIVINDYESGMDILELVEKHEISSRTVYKILKRHKIPKRVPRRVRK